MTNEIFIRSDLEINSTRQNLRQGKKLTMQDPKGTETAQFYTNIHCQYLVLGTILRMF